MQEVGLFRCPISPSGNSDSSSEEDDSIESSALLAAARSNNRRREFFGSFLILACLDAMDHALILSVS